MRRRLVDTCFALNAEHRTHAKGVFSFEQSTLGIPGKTTHDPLRTAPYLNRKLITQHQFKDTSSTRRDIMESTR